MECVSCYAARQMAEAGDVPSLAEKHDHQDRAVAVYRGMTLCRRHLNVLRGMPVEYPDVPLDDETRRGLADFLEEWGRQISDAADRLRENLDGDGPQSSRSSRRSKPRR